MKFTTIEMAGRRVERLTVVGEVPAARLARGWSDVAAVAQVSP